MFLSCVLFSAFGHYNLFQIEYTLLVVEVEIKHPATTLVNIYARLYSSQVLYLGYVLVASCFAMSLRPRSHGTGSVWSPYQFEKSQEEHDS